MPKHAAFHETFLHLRHREAEGRGDPWWQYPKTGSPRCCHCEALRGRGNRDDGAPCAVLLMPKHAAFHETFLHLRHREAEGRGDPWWQYPKTGSPRCCHCEALRGRGNRDDGAPCAVLLMPKHAAFHETFLHLRHREAEGRGDPWWQYPKTGSPRCCHCEALRGRGNRDDGAPCALLLMPKHVAFHATAGNVRQPRAVCTSGAMNLCIVRASDLQWQVIAFRLNL